MSIALAQEAPVTPPPVDDRPSRTCSLCGDRTYDVEVALPLWIPWVSGQFASGDIELDPSGESDFGKNLDIQSSLRFAMVGRIAARYGPYGVLADGFGATIAEEIRFVLTDGEIAEVEIGAAMVRTVATYRAPLLRLGHRERPFLLAFVPYAGTRWVRIELEFNGIADPYGNVRRWTDPVVGTRVHLDFRNGLTLWLEGDVGGFQVGSIVAGWLSGAIEYAFLDWLALSAGWSFYRLRQDVGAGEGALDISLQLHGPQITLAFHIRPRRPRSERR